MRLLTADDRERAGLAAAIAGSGGQTIGDVLLLLCELEFNAEAVAQARGLDDQLSTAGRPRGLLDREPGPHASVRENGAIFAERVAAGNMMDHVMASDDPENATTAINELLRQGPEVVAAAVGLLAEPTARLLADGSIELDDALDFATEEIEAANDTSNAERDRFAALPAWAQAIDLAYRASTGAAADDELRDHLRLEILAGPTYVSDLIAMLANAEFFLRGGLSPEDAERIDAQRVSQGAQVDDLDQSDDPPALGHVFAFLAHNAIAGNLTNADRMTSDLNTMLVAMGDTEARVGGVVLATLWSQLLVCAAALPHQQRALSDVIELLTGDELDLTSRSNADAVTAFVGRCGGTIRPNAAVPKTAATGATEPDPSWVLGWIVARTVDSTTVPTVETNWDATTYHVLTTAGSLRRCEGMYFGSGLTFFADNAVIADEAVPSELTSWLTSRLRAGHSS